MNPAEHGTTSLMRVEIRKLVRSDKHSEEHIEFVLRNVDNSFANGLRRVLLAEVPILAIEQVDVVLNTSVYHDEMLVHRMGLVPFWSEAAEEMNFPHACPCSGRGCKDCEVNCELKVRCHSSYHSRAVYAEDIIVDQASREKVRPCTKDKGVWLFTLGRGQEVDFRCKIRKGIAKVHSRFMAVATVAMQYVMDIRLNHLGIAALSPENRQMWVDRCPTKVFSYEARDGSVDIQNVEACTYCKECFDLDKPFDTLPAPLVNIRPRKNVHGLYDTIFKIDTTGALPAVLLMERAIRLLKNKIQTIQKALESTGVPRPGDIPTRTIGQAPTAVLVPNQEAIRKSHDDELGFANDE